MQFKLKALFFIFDNQSIWISLEEFHQIQKTCKKSCYARQCSLVHAREVQQQPNLQDINGESPFIYNLCTFKILFTVLFIANLLYACALYLQIFDPEVKNIPLTSTFTLYTALFSFYFLVVFFCCIF